jgi:methylenetetrahydrofolate--tRNA-(uracil-5-)-methyltransferase
VSTSLTVIGGGLAGCEAAWFAAAAGCDVRLCEMRPVRGTEAHQTEQLAELVCSNSFRNNSLETAVGLLKDEMRRRAGGRPRALRRGGHRRRHHASAHPARA